MAFGDGVAIRSTGSKQALQVLAKSFFRELKRAGYGRAEMLAFASELIDLVTRECRVDGSDGVKTGIDS